jgi:hypothetical protein
VAQAMGQSAALGWSEVTVFLSVSSLELVGKDREYW